MPYPICLYNPSLSIIVRPDWKLMNWDIDDHLKLANEIIAGKN